MCKTQMQIHFYHQTQSSAVWIPQSSAVTETLVCQVTSMSHSHRNWVEFDIDYIYSFIEKLRNHNLEKHFSSKLRQTQCSIKRKNTTKSQSKSMTVCNSILFRKLQSVRWEQQLGICLVCGSFLISALWESRWQQLFQYTAWRH